MQFLIYVFFRIRFRWDISLWIAWIFRWRDWPLRLYSQRKLNDIEVGASWRHFYGQRLHSSPESKVHGANMGPTWVLSALVGPHVGPVNFAIWIVWNNEIRRHHDGVCVWKIRHYWSVLEISRHNRVFFCKTIPRTDVTIHCLHLV